MIKPDETVWEAIDRVCDSFRSADPKKKRELRKVYEQLVAIDERQTGFRRWNKRLTDEA